MTQIRPWLIFFFFLVCMCELFSMAGDEDREVIDLKLKKI